MRVPRALISLSFLLLTAVVCTAQEARPAPTPEEFQTKLESLMSETGAVLVKGYTRVGSMNGSRGTAFVTAWEVINVRTGQREQGVTVEMGEGAGTRADVEERAYIDYDELGPLLKGIDYILELDEKATKLSRYEAQYQTRGGLVLVNFNTPSGYLSAISTWGGRRPRFVLRQTGLAEFKNLLEKCQGRSGRPAVTIRRRGRQEIRATAADLLGDGQSSERVEARCAPTMHPLIRRRSAARRWLRSDRRKGRAEFTWFR